MIYVKHLWVYGVKMLYLIGPDGLVWVGIGLFREGNCCNIFLQIIAKIVRFALILAKFKNEVL